MDLIQAVCLTPGLEFLEKRGVNIDRHLRAVDLDVFDTRNSSAWLPKESVFRLLERLNRYELSDKPLEDLEPAYRLRNTHHYGQNLLSAPNMLTAAKRATDPKYSVLTYHRVDVGFQRGRARLRSRYNHRRQWAEHFIEGCSLILMLDALVEFGTEHCRLSTLDITLNNLPETTLPIDLSKTKIRTEQPAHKATFPLSWLSRSARSKVQPRADTGWGNHALLSDRLIALFEALERGKRPSLELISRHTSVAKRTIQRTLAKEHTSFKDLVDQWTAQKALEEIHDPNLPLSDLAERLGYSDPSHFTRAFRRWVGLGPQSYRDSLQ